MDAIDFARFWSRVEVGHIKKCWPWKGWKNPFGYGSFKVDGESMTAHRAAYQFIHGPPDRPVIRHKCDNPPCCNPTHLVAGTHIDNVIDRVVRDRSAIGVRNGRARLSENDVMVIRASRRSNSEMAKAYGVNHSTISAIRLRLSWKHVA